MDIEKMTNEELTQRNKAGEPLTGLPVYTPGASGFGLRDPKGNAVGDTWYSIETPTPSVTDQSARIGDYVLQKGKPVLIPNSPTDISLRTQIVSGGTEKPEYDFSFWDSLRAAGSGAIIGFDIGKHAGPVGAAAGTVIGGATSLIGARTKAAEEALEAWKKHEVDVRPGVDFYRDEDGKLRYKLRTQDMAAGGARSGSIVKEAQDRETEVSLGDDGRLKINVSPIFASTAAFQDILKIIQENLSGLNKDTENLDQILNTIRDAIQKESDDFIVNSQLYADYATRFDADPKYIVAAYTDEAIGYVDPANMDNFDMVVLNEDGEISNINASKFFDYVYGLDLSERGALVGRLTQIAYGSDGYENYSEDQRVIAYGELKALWAVSENKQGYESKYQGMLNDEFFTSFLNSFSPLRVNLGDSITTFSNGSIDLKSRRWLNQNELGSTLGVFGGTYLTLKGFKALFGSDGSQGIIGRILKRLPGTSSLYNSSLWGAAGAKGELVSTLHDLFGEMSVKEIAKASAASFAFETIKVGIYEAAINGVRSAVSGTDFWKEFTEDFGIDLVINAVLQYYNTIRLTASISSGKKFMYRDPKTGNLKVLPTYEERIFESAPEEEKIVEESLYDADGNRVGGIWSTEKEGGTSVYEPVGSFNVRKTASGSKVGAIRTTDNVFVVMDDKVLVISPDNQANILSLNPGDIDLGEFPALKDGIVALDEEARLANMVDKSLELAGLPKDTEVFSVPKDVANAAIVAGKLAKLDSSKIMLKINTSLFNRNALLDAVNQSALAKTADLTAYLKRTEYFASDMQNAARAANEIATGAYYKPAKEAFNNYDELIAKANLSKRWSKADSNYINAIGEIARAELLDKTKSVDDPNNYVEAAMKVYGKDLTAVSPDRAEELNKIQEARIERNRAIIESARKSGKVDIAKLEKVTDSDVQKIGWVPIWGKKTTYNGLLDRFYGIEQERNPYRGWAQNNEWVPTKELMSPLQADSDFLSLISTNMGLNDKNEMIVEAFEDNGLLIDNTPSERTVRERKLSSIKNKDELKKKLDQMVSDKKKAVEEKALTPKQYKQRMVDLYEEYDIDSLITKAISGERIPTINTSEKTWREWWKGATPGMRNEVKKALAENAQLTGFGIDDTRARLNSLVPGFDVLDWSLLGREHTNGLAPEIGYYGMDNPVKAYIMPIDELRALVGLDKEKTMFEPYRVQKIEKLINTKGGGGVLPLRFGGGQGDSFYLEARWGNSSDDYVDWNDYLNYLESKGVTNVPVAVEFPKKNLSQQARMTNFLNAVDKAIATGKKPDLDYKDVAAVLRWFRDPSRVVKRLRDSAPEEEFSWGEIWDLVEQAKRYNSSNAYTEENLDDLSVEDQIKNVLRARNYGKELSAMDITEDIRQAFNEYGRIPFYRGQKGLGQFNMNEMLPTTQVGDAYWIAPNANYTDSYGKDKIAGTIPVKYFMSDKEKNEITSSLSKKQAELEEKMHNAFVKAAGKSDEIDSLMRFFPELTSGELNRTRTYRELIASDSLKSDLVEEYDKAIEFMEKALTKKELQEYNRIVDVVNNPRYFEATDKSSKERVKSYRALAEYAGKPVIDISEDGFANGTAYFYYKGVDPKFDEEIGQQLATQALFEKQSPRWSREGIEDAMEKYDGMSLDELIDRVTMGEGFGGDWDLAFENFNDGDISSSELSEVAKRYFKTVKITDPGIGEVMLEIWDSNAIKDPRDMRFKYWDGSGIATISDDTAGQFLEDMGETPDLNPTPIDVSGEQASLYDAIKPTAENIPTNYVFKQPSTVAFGDYRRGVIVDPTIRKRIAQIAKTERLEQLVQRTEKLLLETNKYLQDFGYTTDIKTYMNTGVIPELQKTIEIKTKEGASDVVKSAMVETTPYVPKESLLKDELEKVAEDWYKWAEKNIKAGRTSSKDLKKFAEDNNLDLPKDKRPMASKVKHALWQKVLNGEKMPKISGAKISEIVQRARGWHDKILKSETGSVAQADASEQLKKVKKEFYSALDQTLLFRGATKDKRELIDLVASEVNAETEDPYTMGVSKEATGMGGSYPLTFYKNGRPYTRFAKYDDKSSKLLVESTYNLQTDRQLVRRPGIVRRFAQLVANDFRNLTTGWDPSRAPLNRLRDLGRGYVSSAGMMFTNPKRIIDREIDAGNYTLKQKEELKQAIDRSVKLAQGATYNESFKTPRKAATAITKRYLESSNANKLKVFRFNIRSDKRSILEWPMNFFENLTRKNLTQSAAAAKLVKARVEGKGYAETVEDVTAAAEFAGKEYTANFGRKGAVIGEIAPLTAYLSSGFSGFDSLKKAFIANPTGVTKAFSLFLLLYAILLCDALGDDKSRKNYYRLSEYDRSNSIVIALDSESLLTIPMDQELASLVFPYRRIIETMNNVDPVSFWEFIWGTFTEPIPFDLSGFSEGGYFNLKRGAEKLRAQATPDLVEKTLEVSTGYDPYYGRDLKVTDEDLREYGIYGPDPGDYTTVGKNSLFLRNVANLTGIPQWQLQATVESFGGNVGQYVLYTIDKLAGATEEERGGKSFADTMFNSLVGSDKETAENMFYDGLDKLEEEKGKLMRKISGINEKMETATGDQLYDYQSQIRKAKDEYATKVGDYVNQYLNAYEITGGLSKSQAMKIYYLFRFDDDSTIYQKGSVAEYYNDKAKQQFKNEATSLAAPILDKYYNNRTGNIYQDSDGVWRRYLPMSMQSLRNTIYGEGEEHKVNLLNILEGKDSSLKNLRTKVKEARSDAYEKKDFDERDRVGYEFDKKVIEAISPYIERYGAKNVLASEEVLDYLSDWFFVPDSFKRTKRGGYVSLANNAQTEEAFVRPYIKYVFGLPTNYYPERTTEIKGEEFGK